MTVPRRLAQGGVSIDHQPGWDGTLSSSRNDSRRRRPAALRFERDALLIAVGVEAMRDPLDVVLGR